MLGSASVPQNGLLFPSARVTYAAMCVRTPYSAEGIHVQLLVAIVLPPAAAAMGSHFENNEIQVSTGAVRNFRQHFFCPCPMTSLVLYIYVIIL